MPSTWLIVELRDRACGVLIGAATELSFALIVCRAPVVVTIWRFADPFALDGQATVVVQVGERLSRPLPGLSTRVPGWVPTAACAVAPLSSDSPTTATAAPSTS